MGVLLTVSSAFQLRAVTKATLTLGTQIPDGMPHLPQYETLILRQLKNCGAQRIQISGYQLTRNW